MSCLYQPSLLFAAEVGKPEIFINSKKFSGKGGEEAGEMKMVVEDGQEPVLEHLCICAVVIFIPSLSRFKELERRLVFVIL